MNNEKIEKELKRYIENIEQLGADARYYNDYKNYSRLKTEFDSIIYWADKANKILNSLEKGEK